MGSLRKQHVPGTGSVEQKMNHLIQELLQVESKLWLDLDKTRPLVALRLSASLYIVQCCQHLGVNGLYLSNWTLSPLVALLLCRHSFNTVARPKRLKTRATDLGTHC